MSPIRVEIESFRYINDETLTIGERRIKKLGGHEGVEVARFVEGEETYWVRQVDPDRPDIQENLQKIVVSDQQPSGHFFIGDTRISAEYIKSGS